MRVRWFGETWDAPICEDGYQVESPLGEVCLYCEGVIEDGERGVLTAASPSIEGTFRWWIGGHEVYVAAYHIDCFLSSIIPDHLVRVSRRP